MRCIRLLYIMARWELMRILYERGLVQRLVLPHIIFLIWIVANGVFLPWILQTHQVILGLILVSSGMLILPRVADSFAGERERATLEVLLLSPVPDWILVAGKTMALLAIATLSFVTALCVYGIATVLFISSAPPVIWYAMALLIGLTALLTLIHMENPARTTLIATHNMAEAARMCNYFVVLRDGQLLFSGFREKLISDTTDIAAIEAAFVHLFQK